MQEKGNAGEGADVEFKRCRRAMHRARHADGAGFYRLNSKSFGRHLVMLALPSRGHRRVSLQRPNTGHSALSRDLADVRLRYTRLEPFRAAEEWEAHFARSRDACSHGGPFPLCLTTASIMDGVSSSTRILISFGISFFFNGIITHLKIQLLK